ncbi:BTB/POZ domain-containing protein [Ditylenchus destructor]|nr:BTB/POZ domain-containing protein [Ditylenchus destructor]
MEDYLIKKRSPFKSLDVAVYCDRGCASETWKYETKYTLHVVAQKEGVKDIIRQNTKASFNGAFLASSNCEYSEPTTCNMLLDPENGFIKDDTIILQAHVQATSVKLMFEGHTTENGLLFSSSTKYPWDFVLTIHGKEIHVQKSYLAVHSEYFKEQFVKHERVKRAIMQDVDYGAFIELLTVIYPTAYPITAKNVETITELAFKFYMADLLKRCEVFLMENISKFDKAKLLLIAECKISNPTKNSKKSVMFNFYRK